MVHMGRPLLPGTQQINAEKFNLILSGSPIDCDCAYTEQYKYYPKPFSFEHRCSRTEINRSNNKYRHNNCRQEKEIMGLLMEKLHQQLLVNLVEDLALMGMMILLQLMIIVT